MKTVTLSLLAGVFIRLGLMVYGLWQDSIMAVKYTDIDYYVFTDAARFMVKVVKRVAAGHIFRSPSVIVQDILLGAVPCPVLPKPSYQSRIANYHRQNLRSANPTTVDKKKKDYKKIPEEGDSPYMRATYRYTPLLAWILQPNIWWTPIYGKMLFILCDVLAGYLIYSIVKKNHNMNIAKLCAQMWLLNPLPIVVSSRGNAESVIVVLVLMTLYVFIKPHNVWNITICSVLYGLSIHMKIYPITYAVPFYLSLVNMDKVSNARGELQRLIGCNILPNWRSLLFILITVSVILLLTVVCFHWYGFRFIQETYLYHVTRRDTRHNFSPYFYMLYLMEDNKMSGILGLMAFIPQMILLLIISFTFYEDLPFCCFLHTFIFVSFNKVCTSQYFLWYLCLLPLIIPQLCITLKEACFLILLWFGGQGIWLLPAYYLEFEGHNTFIFIWMSGLVFLLLNVWILHRVIHNYEPITQTKISLLKLKQKYS